MKEPGKKDPLRRRAEKVLRKQLNAVERNRFDLYVPPVKHQYDASRGDHFHHAPELFVQVGGISSMVFPHTTIDVPPGGILLVPRGVLHEEYSKGSPDDFMNFVFAYSVHEVNYHVAVLAGNRRPRVIEFDTIESDSELGVSRYLDEIVTLNEQGYDLHGPAVRGLLTAHFGCLLEFIARPHKKKPDIPFKVAQCRELIRRRISMPTLGVEYLANEISCSADYLSNLFRRTTGSTITAHINRLRIQQSLVLLENSTMNISEIAWACGYSDPGYFTRLFSQANSMNPQTYRKNASLRMPVK